MDKEIKDILSKYQSKLNENVKLIEEYNPESYTIDYRIFRDEALSRTLTSYEAFCNFFEKILLTILDFKKKIESVSGV